MMLCLSFVTLLYPVKARKRQNSGPIPCCRHARFRTCADRKFYFQTLVDGHAHDPLLINAFPPVERQDMLPCWAEKGELPSKPS
jgi:hypothetical protein